MSKGSRTRALGLVSGGLDSLLAVRLLEEQGIEVTGLTFVSPFFGCENARKGSARLGIELIVVDITSEIVELIKSPPHGFGKQMNPCIDCHTLMVKKAGEIAEQRGFDFIFTGEVLGERPMSQNRQSLDTVARGSGFADILLRPLSAKLLPPTRPEREGIVDRERLMDIEGRSRKPQIALAARYGITEYVQPAGGCLLTDPAFSARLRELLAHDPDAAERDVRLLRIGRHFRLPSGAKAILGRNKEDNRKIVEQASAEDALIVSDITPGPALLIVGRTTGEELERAARLCASFSDSQGDAVDMRLKWRGEERRVISSPRPKKEFASMRV